MASEGTLKVHQPPLLRRPRPPKALTAPPPKANDHHRPSPRKSLHGHYTDSTTLSTHCTHDVHTKTNFSIHPLYPKGPSFFPPGKKMVACHGAGAVYLPPLYNNEEIYNKSVIGNENNNDSMNFEHLDSLDNFTLAEFQMVAPQRRVLSPINSAKVISRQNYLKLTGWFAVNVPTQESLNTVELEAALESPQERKPRHQVLLELQSMVDEAMMAGSSSVSVEEEEEESREVMEPPDIVIGGSVSRYFCGQRRSRSPFMSSDQPQISPSELAILDCMLSGGRCLDLKAHFLSQLPDLSPLAKTLTYLNLSFNCLNVFPVEVLQLSQLVSLQLRNNPIKELPNDIRNLTKLRVLCLSFNLLSDLPSGLFDLQSLCDLDLSYNTLHSLPRHISMLMTLRKLNVEGNQLIGVPSTMMTLPLTHLLVGDNLMHPVLWVENSRNQPQDLVDLCSMLVSKCVSATDDPRLPEQVISVLQRSSCGQRCDHCQCPLYGCGLRVIRSVGGSVLGIINLPFVFLTCSPSCSTSLKQRTKWKLPFESKAL